MKNIKLLLAACTMLLVFGSCGNGQNGTTGKEALVTNSPDLTFWELQGPVNTCDEVEFDRQGMMVRYSEYNPFIIDAPFREIDEEGYMEEFAKWERNEAGQISTITGIEGITYYTWGDGKVVHCEGFQEGTEFATDFEYNEDGLLMKIFEYMRDALDEEAKGEMPLWSTTEYIYFKFDDHGNWIHRNVSVAYAGVDSVEKYGETRTITYFE